MREHEEWNGDYPISNSTTFQPYCLPADDERDQGGCVLVRASHQSLISSAPSPVRETREHVNEGGYHRFIITRVILAPRGAPALLSLWSHPMERGGNKKGENWAPVRILPVKETHFTAIEPQMESAKAFHTDYPIRNKWYLLLNGFRSYFIRIMLPLWTYP